MFFDFFFKSPSGVSFGRWYERNQFSFFPVRPSLYNPLWQEWIQKLSLMHSKFLKVFEFISILKLFPFMFTPKKLFKLPFKNTIIFDAAVPSVFFFFFFFQRLPYFYTSFEFCLGLWLALHQICTQDSSVHARTKCSPVCVKAWMLLVILLSMFPLFELSLALF